MTYLLRLGSRSARQGMTVAGVSLLLAAGSAHADVTLCRNKLQAEVGKLRKALSTAMKTCKAKIGAEHVKGVLSGHGTDCTPGGGCMATAAHACELALRPVYNAANTVSKPSKVAVFRKHLEKLRQGKCLKGGAACHANADCPAVLRKNACSAVCTDEDLTIKLARNGTDLGHLVSGALGYAPPASGSCDLDGDGRADPNCAAKFMTDHLLFATENLIIKQQLMTDPDTLALFRDAVGATYGGAKMKKATSCTVPTDPTTQEFRPNLCRFGPECLSRSCQIDTTASCPDNGACDVRDSSGACSNDASPCNATDPHACGDHPEQCIRTACGGGLCRADASYVSLTSPQGSHTIPVLGGFNLEMCEVSSLGGEGPGFNVEPGFLYLTNLPDKTQTALIPPQGVPGIQAVCVQIVRSEGWCDCLGAGLRKHFSLCQDHVTSGSGTDACGTAIDPASLDTRYTGTVDGKASLTPTGASTAGDCVDLVSMQFSVIADRNDFGPDGVPCTVDDLTVPAPPLNVVLTTGTTSVQLFDAVASPGGCQRSGHCSTHTTQVCDASVPSTCPGVESCNRDTCVQDVNCRHTSFATDTCGNPAPTLAPLNLSLSGAKTSCENYRASNLNGFAVAGAIATVNDRLMGDAVTAFRFTCK